ncbi:MAG: hypothetical protein HKM00_12245 [Gallionella sp.]|jgi:hypothetical protein|nr:hypothetical protein [Gallionella sp.]
MKNVHLILPDLFLPGQFAADMSADLVLPALQKLLSRATAVPAPARSVEAALCAAFGVNAPDEAGHDVPVAPVSAAFDGLGAGCWLRADPVHLRLQRDQMLLSQAAASDEEARQFCASLNEYFSGQGMTFFAPHTERWYLRLDRLPDMQTTPLSEVIGANVRGALPRGEDAQRWHQVFNEIQMVLFAHPLNDAREARGELPINSLWLWGGGTNIGGLEKTYDQAGSDEVMAEMFAAAAAVPYRTSAGSWQAQPGTQLLLFGALRSALQAGDLHAWRVALQTFETDYAQPLWDALRGGKLARLQIDVLAGKNSQCLVMTRGDTWRFWRRGKRLAMYSIV